MYDGTYEYKDGKYVQGMLYNMTVMLRWLLFCVCTLALSPFLCLVQPVMSQPVQSDWSLQSGMDDELISDELMALESFSISATTELNTSTTHEWLVRADEDKEYIEPESDEAWDEVREVPNEFLW